MIPKTLGAIITAVKIRCILHVRVFVLQSVIPDNIRSTHFYLGSLVTTSSSSFGIFSKSFVLWGGGGGENHKNTQNWENKGHFGLGMTPL